VGEAENGLDAVRMNQELKPDVITMDLEMPDMDGLAASKQIMNDAPRPIIMVSAFTQKESKATLDALNLGASDYVSKSSSYLGLDIAHIETELKNKIRQWASASESTRKQKRLENLTRLGKIHHTLSQRHG
jgi:two-component system chemotaxis response regulator CheB